jgi:hypothetical protein
MSTEPRKASRPDPGSRPGRRSGWELPAFSLVLGGVLWVAAWVGGYPGLGLAMFAIMAAFGAVFVVGRRSESIRMMAAGRGADACWRSIDLRATAIAGLVLISAVIVAFVWGDRPWPQWASPTPLGAIAGVSYLVALVWFRWRS